MCLIRTELYSAVVGPRSNGLLSVFYSLFKVYLNYWYLVYYFLGLTSTKAFCNMKLYSLELLQYE